ncbi:MAG: lipoprotein signal peptidase [Flavobacteriaceae bacterium]|nr:lipoprotein signal peptidase [Flavobacteriaceae bacterium]
MSKKNIALLTIILAILIDQIVKIYVKTHFSLNESVDVFDWFKIHFVENNGMAMGFEFGGKAGKLFLTLFRLVAVVGIVYWLVGTIKKKLPNVAIVAIALIFAGAVGNIIDSVFYGVIFNTPTHGVATLFPEQAYGSLFYGKVVDMFHFPIWEGTWPSWIPFIGGEQGGFFSYIFNPADAYITIGVALLFIFSKKAFPKEEKKA